MHNVGISHMQRANQNTGAAMCHPEAPVSAMTSAPDSLTDTQTHLYRPGRVHCLQSP